MVGEAVMERLEANEALDRVTDKVAPILEQALCRPAIGDALTGRWLGHPVHPMSAVAPLGFGSPLPARPAGRSAHGRCRPPPGGPGRGVGAADGGVGSQRLDLHHGRRAPGRRRPRRTNNVATGLFALSWWSRARGRRLRGVALGLAGSAAAGVGGFLGGHLAYRLGVGVNTTAFQAGPGQWTPVLEADRLVERETGGGAGRRCGPGSGAAR